MIKYKSIGVIAVLLMAISVMFLSFGYLNPSIFENFTGLPEPPYVAAMDKTQVLDIQIVADEVDWADMIENSMDEEYIVATVIINGVKVENVGIRPKGNSSLMQVASDSTTDRYSFKIRFDKYVEGQTWLGLDKIVVNNMQGDSTYMKEYLSYDLMSYGGVATPMYAFSNITVNGEKWGFYLAVEVLEDSYAKRVYGNDYGKLYKPESMGMRGNGQIMGGFRGNMEDDNEANFQQQGKATGNNNQNIIPDSEEERFNGRRMMNGFGGGSGAATLQYIDDNISSYSVIFDGAVFDISDNDRKRLISTIKKLNVGEDLENTVDVEATLKYFAAHTVIVNLDSYISNMCHNYYLYEKDGQLTMLPWDFNLAFGGFQSGDASAIVNFPIDTPVSGINMEDRPILAKLLEVPDYLELYHSYLHEIVDGYFNSGIFERNINTLDILISPYVESDPSAFYDFDDYQQSVIELKKIGLLRAESIEGQLNGNIPATTAEQNLNPDALVDASSINLSVMGGEGMFGGMQNFNPENMQRIMEIIQSAGDGELTEKQLSELKNLDITEEQVQNMRQGGFGDERPYNAQEGMNWPQRGSLPVYSTNGIDSKSLIILCGCTTLLLGGLLFVIFFKRRKYI